MANIARALKRDLSALQKRELDKRFRALESEAVAAGMTVVQMLLNGPESVLVCNGDPVWVTSTAAATGCFTKTSSGFCLSDNKDLSLSMY